jgi:alkanesulfonate monooxygenase SsuD/methylene tetrahydromethanopterin reductase-like flavin-dependent oxidoreductase (luciferase family)
VALYVGGMGHQSKNFHNDVMVRRGYAEAAKRIQELYLAKRYDEAIAAVPDEYVDEGALVGPPDRIAKRFHEWQDSGATGLTVTASDQPEALELVAKLARA